MNNTPQGGATEGNPAKRGTDDTLMVDQGPSSFIDIKMGVC